MQPWNADTTILYMHTEDNPKSIEGVEPSPLSQFRPISLFSVRGNLFESNQQEGYWTLQQE